MAHVLIVDDDEALRLQLKYALQDEHVLGFAADGREAVALMARRAADVVLLDLGLPPSAPSAAEGLKTLEHLLRIAPRAKIIVMTGNTDRENAVKAVTLGAFDYHPKPVDLEALRVVIRRAVYLQSIEREGETSSRLEEETTQFEELLGKTAAMRAIFATVSRVAKTNVTVLVEGESGTGKELIARALHKQSRRRTGPFIAINCGAIPETLIEAELFGHEKGAFTGAHVQRKGKVELADGGTLFLDEIGELSLHLQVKLLRFLQDRTIERIGGREPISVDCRIVAATNQELKAQLERKTFRHDLYYRLSVVSVHVPPLRHRGEDILLLANAFLRRAAQEHRRAVRFSGESMEAMMAYAWPGNIRELENKVSRAVIMARERVITPADLDFEPTVSTPRVTLSEVRGRAEREAVVAALTRHRGNISTAARELKVSRPTLHALLAKYRIDAKAFR